MTWSFGHLVFTFLIISLWVVLWFASGSRPAVTDGLQWRWLLYKSRPIRFVPWSDHERWLVPHCVPRTQSAGHETEPIHRSANAMSVASDSIVRMAGHFRKRFFYILESTISWTDEKRDESASTTVRTNRHFPKYRGKTIELRRKMVCMWPSLSPTIKINLNVSRSNV